MSTSIMIESEKSEQKQWFCKYIELHLAKDNSTDNNKFGGDKSVMYRFWNVVVGM